VQRESVPLPDWIAQIAQVLVQVTRTEFPEVLLIEPEVHHGHRGWLKETYHLLKLKDQGVDVTFVQENYVHSKGNTLRGMHFQFPNSQGKMIQCVQGAIFDVIVDIRRSSPRFGKWMSHSLADHTHQQLWIPPGFAHGYYAVTRTTDVLYRMTAAYDPVSERGFVWNDRDVGICWPNAVGSGTFEPITSEKDARACRSSGIFRRRTSLADNAASQDVCGICWFQSDL
jgi:dTDP-4-dehydrorhamnose 3,5-epimerase